jgi:hypothetical protein
MREGDFRLQKINRSLSPVTFDRRQPSNFKGICQRNTKTLQ